MSTVEPPVFGHIEDAWRYQANVEAGYPLCDRCRGGGNDLFSMYRPCPECSGAGHHHVPEPKPIARDRSDDLADAMVPAVWPEAAEDEEGTIWTRRDVAKDAAEAEALLMDPLDEGWVLVRVREEPMIFRPESQMYDGWEIAPAHEDEHDQAALYVRWIASDGSPALTDDPDPPSEPLPGDDDEVDEPWPDDVPAEQLPGDDPASRAEEAGA